MSLRFNLARVGIFAAALGAVVNGRGDVLSSVQSALDLLNDAHLAADTNAIDRAVIESVARAIDPGARVLSSNEWVQLENERAGLTFQTGLRLSISNSIPIVADVAKESPASRAGVRKGDVIAAVNGQALSNETIVTATRLLRSNAEGTLRLTINATNDVDIGLQQLPLPDIETAEDWPDHLSYLRFNGLYTPETVQRMETRIGAKGLILDLRSAGGDDAECAGAAADLVASKRGAVVAIVDARTTGAAELLAALLSGRVHNAIIVGEQTAGGLLLREASRLPSGEILFFNATNRLTVTTNAIYDGRSGVVPDLPMTTAPSPQYESAPDDMDRRIKLEEEDEDRWLRARLRGDPALIRATDVLLGLQAMDINANATPTNPDR